MFFQVLVPESFTVAPFQLNTAILVARSMYVFPTTISVPYTSAVPFINWRGRGRRRRRRRRRSEEERKGKNKNKNKRQGRLAILESIFCGLNHFHFDDFAMLHHTSGPHVFYAAGVPTFKTHDIRSTRPSNIFLLKKKKEETEQGTDSQQQRSYGQLCRSWNLDP